MQMEKGDSHESRQSNVGKLGFYENYSKFCLVFLMSFQKLTALLFPTYF
jgi:hypothetical protein